MFFTNVCVIVLWTKVASALEGLRVISHLIHPGRTCCFDKLKLNSSIKAILEKYVQDDGAAHIMLQAAAPVNFTQNHATLLAKYD